MLIFRCDVCKKEYKLATDPVMIGSGYFHDDGDWKVIFTGEEYCHECDEKIEKAKQSVLKKIQEDKNKGGK